MVCSCNCLLYIFYILCGVMWDEKAKDADARLGHLGALICEA